MLPINFNPLQSLGDMQGVRANQQAQINSFADPFESAIKTFGEVRKSDNQDEKKAKAEQVHAMIMTAWNDPAGIFKGMETDSAKARKASALMAPWSDEESNYWMRYANELEQGEKQNVFKANESEADRLLKTTLEANKPKPVKDVSPEDKKLMANQLAGASNDESAYNRLASKYAESIDYIPAFSSGPQAIRDWSATVSKGADVGAKLSGDITGQNLSNIDKQLGNDFNATTFVPRVEQVSSTLAGSNLANIGKGLSNQIEAVNAKQKSITGEQLEAPAKPYNQGGLIKYKGIPEEFSDRIEEAKDGFGKYSSLYEGSKIAGDQLKNTIEQKGKKDGQFVEMKGIPLNTVIYEYNKIIDPAAVVRESDVTMAEQSGGLIGKALSLMNLISSKTTLPASTIKEIYDTADLVALAMEASKNRMIQRYGRVALENGIDAKHVVGGGNKATFYKNAPKINSEGDIE
jgi:hypothetical protein